MSEKIKKKKNKRKVSATTVWSIIISLVAGLGVVAFALGVGLIMILLNGKPTLDVKDFEQQESSIIFDSKGEEIANLGLIIRSNVTFDEMPNSLINSFVAIEDSRFFEHNGFDLPRFTKAMIDNVLHGGITSGGSTFTMQLVKNTYYVDDETGMQADREGAAGIRRKVQEIALALDLTGKLSKQTVFESYVNKLNFGVSNNSRGVQKAAKYYFGKNVQELNLVESAYLAGVINMPYGYNAFYHIEDAQERTLEVLYQMYNHGYITKTEYELAKTVKLENLLLDPYSSKEENTGIPYQAYVDQVVSEVINLTGLDPYTTTMQIYTYMNKQIQEDIDNIQAGNFEDDYLYYPDEFFECASVVIDNDTGAIVGILGGRNYANGGALLLNHATEQYKKPGSSVKPILDYAPAFENLGWATDHVITDKPMIYDDVSNIIIANDSGTYVGDVTLKDAVGQSINTCAIQALQAVIKEKGYAYIVNYAQSLGYEFTLDEFDIQYAIGGTTCEVTPLQNAAAYATIFNGGVYNEPHTIKRIEFTNGKSPVIPQYKSTQVLSEAAAYLTAELMKSNVASYGGTYSFVKSKDYTVYGKTGTTDYGVSGKDYGVPSGAIESGWLVAATSEYTTATWVGYERMVEGQQSYIANNYYYNARPQGKIAHLILESCFTNGDSIPQEIKKPSTVTNITHIIGTWPYAAPLAGMDESFITTGLIKSDSYKLTTFTGPDIEDIKKEGFSATLEGSTVVVKWPEYPNSGATASSFETRTKDISGHGIELQGKCLFDPAWIYGSVVYAVDIETKTVEGTTTNTYTSDKNEKTIPLSLKPGDSIKCTAYYKYSSGDKVSKNKIESETLTKKTTITIPNSASLEQLKSLEANNSFITLNIEYVDNINYSKAGSYEAYDNNNANVKGQEIEVTDNSYKVLITYYTIKEPTLTLSETDKAGEVYALATLDSYTYTIKDNITISYTFNGIEQSSNEYHVEFGESSSVSVTCKVTINYGNGISKTLTDTKTYTKQ